MGTVVKQDCLPPPALFSIQFGTILKRVSEEMNDCKNVYIIAHLSANLFKLKRSHVDIKTITTSEEASFLRRCDSGHPLRDKHVTSHDLINKVNQTLR